MFALSTLIFFFIGEYVATHYPLQHSSFVVSISPFLELQAISPSSLSFSSARRGNAFLRLQPVPMRYAVSCSVSSILSLHA
jgi:hypothetical protein